MVNFRIWKQAGCVYTHKQCFTNKIVVQIIAPYRTDKDKNGVLDKNERISLFAKLESDSAKHDKRASLSNKEIVTRSVISGVIAGGATSVLLKSCRNIKSFAILSVIDSFGLMAGKFLSRKIAVSKTDNINNAINELQTLVGEDNDSAVRYYGSKLV